MLSCGAIWGETLPGELLVRRAEAADAQIIAEIHVNSWRETYAGVMPAGLLAALDINEGAEHWRSRLTASEEGTRDAVFLVQRAGEPPAGFGSCGRQRSERLTVAGYAGEFFAVYVMQSLQRQGAGRRLMGAMAVNLIDIGCDNAAVWVLRDNPVARNFYEALGGARTGVEGVWSVKGLDIPDVAYGWRDLSRLAACA
jgi:GNAT superfamily N-acetyltransferase